MTGYRPDQIAQGVPVLEAIEAAREKQRAIEDAIKIKAEGGFDAEFYFGEQPSYGGEAPDVDPSRGWRRYPRYPSREQAQALASAELLRGEDGSIVAYRLPQDTGDGEA